jgi:hypothetical protein
MPVIPHAFHFFASAGLLLRTDAHAPVQTNVEWEMSLDEALGYVEKIGQVVVREVDGPRPLSCPCQISFFGGEPLTRPDDLERLLDRAIAFQMAGEVWTTAAWVRNYDQAYDTLKALHPKVHGLHVHANARLLDRVGLDRIEDLLNAAYAAAVPVHIRCGVGPGFPLPRALLALAPLSSDSSFVHATHIYLDTPPDRESNGGAGFYLQEPPRLRCAEKFGFLVLPGGDVFACVAGLGFEQLRLGNLAVQTAAEIVAGALARPDLCRLRASGVRHLFDRIAATFAAGLLRPGYLDPCDFHRHVLRTPELVRVLEQAETLEKVEL